MRYFGRTRRPWRAACDGTMLSSLEPGLDYKKSLDVGIRCALTTGIVIYLVGRRGHLGDWLTWRPLQYLGRISYSLYLTHYLTSWIIVSFGILLDPRQRQGRRMLDDGLHVRQHRRGRALLPLCRSAELAACEAAEGVKREGYPK